VGIYVRRRAGRTVLDLDVLDGVGKDRESGVVIRVELAVKESVSYRPGKRGGRRAYFAMFLWTNTSPGFAARTTLSGTRLSEQPIHRTFGVWAFVALSLKNLGEYWDTAVLHSPLAAWSRSSTGVWEDIVGGCRRWGRSSGGGRGWFA